MLVHVERLLSSEEVLRCCTLLEGAQWVDGRVTAGYQSAQVKRNLQLADGSAAAQELAGIVLGALEKNPLFLTAALPQRVFPPLFNRYDVGMGFGNHVDNAIRAVPGTPARIRTDLSATLFLSERGDYDGGELLIEHGQGVQSVKLPAGDLILYPASSVHRVQAVTRGSRLASFFWIQSLVKDDAQRTLLFDLDVSINRLAREHGQTPEVVSLTAVYHNLLRMWAEP